MRFQTGEIILILGVLLFVIGAIAIFTDSLPQIVLQAMGALALIFVGVGVNLKKRKQRNKLQKNILIDFIDKYPGEAIKKILEYNIIIEKSF